MKSSLELKKELIEAGREAVQELIKVAKEKIIANGQDLLASDLAADRLKNAAAAKKLAINDAFEILSKIDSEEEILNSSIDSDKGKPGGFAERRAK
jgi:hypothetical protein